MMFANKTCAVIPAQAGIYVVATGMDSGLRRSDDNRHGRHADEDRHLYSGNDVEGVGCSEGVLNNI